MKMVIETSRPIARVAKELGINDGTLGNWVAAYRREHAGEEPPLTVNERARLRELERETRELKMELETKCWSHLQHHPNTEKAGSAGREESERARRALLRDQLDIGGRPRPAC